MSANAQSSPVAPIKNVPFPDRSTKRRGRGATSSPYGILQRQQLSNRSRCTDACPYLPRGASCRNFSTNAPSGVVLRYVVPYSPFGALNRPLGVGLKLSGPRDFEWAWKNSETGGSMRGSFRSSSHPGGSPSCFGRRPLVGAKCLRGFTR
jgi:hypothetical protein